MRRTVVTNSRKKQLPVLSSALTPMPLKTEWDCSRVSALRGLLTLAEHSGQFKASEEIPLACYVRSTVSAHRGLSTSSTVNRRDVSPGRPEVHNVL